MQRLAAPAEPMRDDPGPLLADALAEGASALDEHTAKRLLASLGVAVPRGVEVGHEASLPEASAGLTPPLALKALAHGALHKSDIGAVRLGLSHGNELIAAGQEVAARMEAAGESLAGFLVEEMVPPGLELVIGGSTDPQLGPMLMLGTGGIFAEVLQDTVFRLCPIDRADAREMIAALRSSPILHGARGSEKADLLALEDALLALGGVDGLFTRHAGKITEFDLNPVIARADGLVAVDARIVLRTGEPSIASVPRKPLDLAPLFQPRSIAVAGASARGTSAGNRFLRLLGESGYAGDVYAIHPSASEIEGRQCYPEFAALPGPVDYAYLTVPAERALDVLADAGGRVCLAQVMASATPEKQAAWERDLLAVAAREGVRLIGPNCMGTHAPSAPFTFMEDVLTEPGDIGIVCQSGGLGMDVLRRGQTLGLRFSGLVTIGNAIDIDASDLFEHFLQDSETKVIGLYVEDVKDGDRFKELARASGGRKPVVILVGGATQLGRAAAASHTGAMGGSDRAWQALAAQTGMILTETLESFLDMLQLCCWLLPREEPRPPEVTLFGNGGGASVLATDALDRAGLRLARPSEKARAAFEEITLPPGASLANPIDLPASVLKEEEGRVSAGILDINTRLVGPYATVIHLNLPVIMGYRHVQGFLPNLMKAVFGGDVGNREHRVLVLRSDGSEDVDAWRRRFREQAARHCVPTFDEVPAAVSALARYRVYEVGRKAANDPSGASK